MSPEKSLAALQLTISECSMFASEGMPAAWRDRVLYQQLDRQRTEARNCAIALASRRAQPRPNVCLCAGSSLAPKEAGGATLLRRDGQRPSTG
jgi:hypothetical protein